MSADWAVKLYFFRIYKTLQHLGHSSFTSTPRHLQSDLRPSGGFQTLLDFLKGSSFNKFLWALPRPFAKTTYSVLGWNLKAGFNNSDFLSLKIRNSLNESTDEAVRTEQLWTPGSPHTCEPHLWPVSHKPMPHVITFVKTPFMKETSSWADCFQVSLSLSHTHTNTHRA